MKSLKVTVENEFLVNDAAEVMVINLDGAGPTEVVRLNGQLYRPTISWLRYFSSDVNETRYSSPVLQEAWFETASDEEHEQFGETGAISHRLSLSES